MQINNVTADQVGRIVAWMRQTDANATAFFDGENLVIADEFAQLAQSVVADGIPALDPPTVLKPYAAAVRYAKEIAGCMVGGVTYPSDRETQAKLTAAALFAQVDNTQTFQWKLADGSFSATLSAAEMIAVAAAVGGYVNACFAEEAEVVAEIDAGTITTREEIDAAFAS
jgi:hypothetical protein